MSNKPHDALARRSLSRPELAGPYLASVLPRELANLLDLSELELLDATFIDPDLSERQADFVYRVGYAGREAYLYVLLEHQRRVDPLMALRLYVYTGRVLDDWLRRNPEARQVPPIVPLLLYNGGEPWSAVTELRDLFDLPPGSGELRAFVPNLRYRVDDLRRTSDEEIEPRAVPAFGTVSLLLLRHGADGAAELLGFLGQLAARWLNRLEDRDDLISAFTYVLSVASAGSHDVLDVMHPALEPRIKEVAVTAADQLRREGLLEGERRLLLKLLGHRFSLGEEALAELRRVHLADATAEQLDAWGTRLLDAKTLEEVFQS